jgi:DUF4097 and DUF4098 domain-containing protein YvlB
MSHKTAVGLGWFLISLGLFFLLYQFVPWEILTPEDRAIILISSGLVLLGCYFALGWIESVFGRELIRGADIFVSVLAFLTILLSITYFFTPLAILTQVGTEEASRKGQTSILVGEASRLSLEVDLLNGDLVLSSSDDEKIMVQYEITTRGLTKAVALSNLNKTRIYVSDSVKGDLLNVKIGASAPELNKVWIKVDLVVSIPSNLELELRHSTLNGRLEVIDLSGSGLFVDIANGRIELSNVYFEEVDISLTNGEIKALISSQDLNFEVINGKVVLEILNNVSGKYSVDVINGDMVVECNISEETGFYFDLSTMHGTIDMDLEDFDFIKWEDRKGVKAETSGYSFAPIQIEVFVDIVNGSIDVKP